MRILISTQEPTIVPSKFLDLCSFVIAHRFSSLQWLKHLSQHVSAADSLSSKLFSKVNISSGSQQPSVLKQNTDRLTAHRGSDAVRALGSRRKGRG